MGLSSEERHIDPRNQKNAVPLRLWLLKKPREGRHNGSSLECISGKAPKGRNPIARGLDPGFHGTYRPKPRRGAISWMRKLHPSGALYPFPPQPGVKTPGYINCTLSGCCPRMHNCEKVDFVNTLRHPGYLSSHGTTYQIAFCTVSEKKMRRGQKKA